MLPHVCNYGPRKSYRDSNICGKTAPKTGISKRVQASEIVHGSRHVRQHIGPGTKMLKRLRDDVVWRRIVGEIYLQEVPVTFGGKRKVLWRDVDLPCQREGLPYRKRW